MVRRIGCVRARRALENTKVSLSRALFFLVVVLSSVFLSSLSSFLSRLSLSYVLFFALSAFVFSLSLCLSFCLLLFSLFPALSRDSECLCARGFQRAPLCSAQKRARVHARKERERERDHTQRERERETRRERVNQYSLPTEVSLSLRSFSPA